MKLAKASGTLGLAVLAAFAAPIAMAQDAGWYGGLNLGQTRAKIDDAKITSTLLGAGFGTSSITDDKSDSGYKLFGGYRVNRNFALEGGYFDLGKFGFTSTTVPAGTLTGSMQVKGLNLDAVGIVPITDKFSAFGRIGVNYAQAKDAFTGSGAVTVLNPNPSKREANYKFGAGLQYDFNESLGMRLEAERYRINDAVGNKGDVDMLSLGLVYRFGAKAPVPAPRASALEPAPVAAAPAPQPVLVPPPFPRPAAPPPLPPPAPKKVSFSADSLFEFGKADMVPAAREPLDKFAAELKGTNFDIITVTGHTDRIGAHAPNMELSTRRADAVKTYLVDMAGIPAHKIIAKGVDGADPVTKPGECVGTKATKALIACLQPDRRVDVEVSGTR